jgi:hypothetical protein
MKKQIGTYKETEADYGEVVELAVTNKQDHNLVTRERSSLVNLFPRFSEFSYLLF